MEQERYTKTVQDQLVARGEEMTRASTEAAHAQDKVGFKHTTTSPNYSPLW